MTTLIGRPRYDPTAAPLDKTYFVSGYKLDSGVEEREHVVLRSFSATLPGPGTWFEFNLDSQSDIDLNAMSLVLKDFTFSQASGTQCFPPNGNWWLIDQMVVSFGGGKVITIEDFGEYYNGLQLQNLSVRSTGEDYIYGVAPEYKRIEMASQDLDRHINIGIIFSGVDSLNNFFPLNTKSADGGGGSPMKFKFRMAENADFLNASGSTTPTFSGGTQPEIHYDGVVLSRDAHAAYLAMYPEQVPFRIRLAASTSSPIALNATAPNIALPFEQKRAQLILAYLHVQADVGDVTVTDRVHKWVSAGATSFRLISNHGSYPRDRIDFGTTSQRPEVYLEFIRAMNYRTLSIPYTNYCPISYGRYFGTDTGVEDIQHFVMAFDLRAQPDREGIVESGLDLRLAPELKLDLRSSGGFTAALLCRVVCYYDAVLNVGYRWRRDSNNVVMMDPRQDDAPLLDRRALFSLDE